MTGRHDFHRYAFRVRGAKLVVVGKPGVWSWEAVNPGTAALLGVPRFEPGMRVLDLGCGTGVIGTAAAKLVPSGGVTLVDCNAVAVTCTRRTLEANHVGCADVRLADGVEGLEAASFDLVLCHLPRGREVQRELIRGAAYVLQPGGRFIFVASTHVGVKGCITYARQLFGRCGVVRQKKGHHVAMTVRPDVVDLPPRQDGYVSCSVAVEGVDLTLVSKPGVFAWDRLDGGTRRLIETMDIGPADRVLDLGCGTGLGGLIAARRAPSSEAVLVDSDLRAVRSARQTLEANGVRNGDVVISDGIAGIVRDACFDVVITNPPFHQGREVDYEVAYRFVQEALKVLRPGGRLFLVANRFIGYDDLLRGLFGNVKAALVDSRYHVLTATA